MAVHRFGTEQQESYVEIGNERCTVLQWNTSQIVCAVGPAAAGSASIVVWVDPDGFAMSLPNVSFMFVQLWNRYYAHLTYFDIASVQVLGPIIKSLKHKFR